MTKVKGTLSDVGTVSGAFAKAFGKTYVKECSKYANTCFSMSRAAGAGLEAGYKGFVAGVKETKSVLKVVKGDAIESKFADISDNFDLEAAKDYERKIDNSKYFYHDEGDFGEEVAKKVAMDNKLGDDVSSMFQSGRNGIDGAFLTKGPPPKLTMIESKASRKGQYGYSSQQMKGGKQYFNDMINSKDPRYADFKKMIKKLEKENPGLVYDYISAETKIKITKVGFGVDEINIKDWTKPVD